MSKKSEQLQQDQLANRWSTTSNPSAGTTAVAVSRSAGALGRLNVDCVTYGANNTLSAATAIATVSIKHASAGGSVISQLPFSVGPGLAASFAAMVNLSGKVAKAISADVSSPGASTTQNVTIAGWEDGQR